MTAAIIVAAGEGSRFGGRKQFLELCGRPLLKWSVDLFQFLSEVDAIVVVAPAGQIQDVKDVCAESSKVIAVVSGGGTRTGSVCNGIAEVPAEADYILVHDAARPLASPELVGRTIAALSDFDGVVPGIPVTDTIKVIDGMLVKATVDRASLRAVQTPQGFRASVIRQTHAEKSLDASATDDASLLEQGGYKVGIIDGDPDNIKITYPDDLEVARLLAGRKGVGTCV